MDKAPRAIRSSLHGLGSIIYHGMGAMYKRKRLNSMKNGNSHKKRVVGFRATRKQHSGYGNVTAHADSSVAYRRRRMPRRRRRRWQKFSKKVKWIINKTIAPCSLLRNVVFDRAAALNKQVLGVASSLSGYGTASDLSDDQITILKDAAQRALSDPAKYYQQSVKISSIVLDVTFENNAFFPQGDPAVEVLTDMEVDVYELQCVKNVYIQDASQTNRDLYDFIVNCTSQQPRPSTDDVGITFIGNPLTSEDIGWTPFQSSKFCQYFKVLKKTKKYMSPGGYFTYQLRNASERVISGYNYDVATDTGGTSTTVQPLMTRHTKLLLFICKGQPTTNAEGTSFWSQPRYTMGQTKTINYRILEKNAPTAYIH